LNIVHCSLGCSGHCQDAVLVLVLVLVLVVVVVVVGWAPNP
jgi:hypothetical protein